MSSEANDKKSDSSKQQQKQKPQEQKQKQKPSPNDANKKEQPVNKEQPSGKPSSTDGPNDDSSATSSSNPETSSPTGLKKNEASSTSSTTSFEDFSKYASRTKSIHLDPSEARRALETVKELMAKQDADTARREAEAKAKGKQEPSIPGEASGSALNAANRRPITQQQKQQQKEVPKKSDATDGNASKS